MRSPVRCALALCGIAAIVLAQESRPRLPEPIDDAEATINAEDLLAHLRYLADDDMKGRRTGSDEEAAAGAYIVKHFEAHGLKPAGEGKGFEQKFPSMTFIGTNLIGVLPGSSQVRSGEYVVVGAHYDHVGLGTFGSRTGASGQIHNGADDNASGTAGMLELVQAFSKKPTKRSILFMAFSGEEMGLIGSKAWCSRPTRQLSKLVAMVNLDMIGRVTDDYLYVGGVGTAPKSFPALIRKLAAPFPFKIEMGPGGTGPSDFQSFYQKDIPVLFMFTGLHEQYHTPADDVELINSPDHAGVVRLTYRLVRHLADDDRKPAFAKDDRQAMPERELPRFQQQIPRLGLVIADADERGAEVTDVEPKSPAEGTGIKPGDVIQTVDGQKPKHIYDLISILGLAPEKSAVKIVLLRDGKKLTKTATLR